MRFTLLAWAIVFTTTTTIAEVDTLRGKVFVQIKNKTTPATQASVSWEGTFSGTITDENGEFKLAKTTESRSLVVSYAGYTSDTVTVPLDKGYLEITLKESSSTVLDEAGVSARRIRGGLLKLDPRTTVLLGEREFQKAACCNLSESFENSPAVDASFSDAVTGTKQIKMLGLDGFYTLIGKEYMPGVRSLNSYYGLSFIPAAWVESIQITKGAGSVVNGFESIAGQINVEMKKPFGHESLLLDQFVNEGGRMETDFMYRKDINEHLATSLFFHGAWTNRMNDRNQDGFLDMPLHEHYQLLNRWQFHTDNNWEGIVSASGTLDEKKAGQMDFQTGDATAYGIDLNTRRYELFAKVGKILKRHGTSLGSQYSFSQTEFRSNYGSAENPKSYNSNATNGYANWLYQSFIGNTNHTFQTGISFMADILDETYANIQYQRDEFVSGGFFEYTYKPKETLSAVLGIRSDYNSIFGWSITPRFHGKYRFNKDKTALRVSAGMGRRTSNPLAQNQFLFASGRIITFPENGSPAFGLEQEVALNTGLSFEHEFRLGYMPASWSFDYFFSSFFNEVVLDREMEGRAEFYNMKNGTRAHSFQSELNLNPARRTDLKFAYRLFDVQTVYRDLGRLYKPFISRHRAFFNITQRTRTDWQFSSTTTWYGAQRIAGTSDYSPDFILVNAQVSKTFKKQFEAFIGIENALNYVQENPIQNADNPFTRNFDAGLVWGPIFGRMTYAGFRWRIKTRME
jgi:outer membrane receptor for ferrienterochelin and colicins